MSHHPFLFHESPPLVDYHSQEQSQYLLLLLWVCQHKITETLNVHVEPFDRDFFESLQELGEILSQIVH